MAVFQGPVSAAFAEVGAAAFSGAHITAKPDSHGTLGHYCLAAVSGTMAAALAANSDIVQFRWSDATRFCRLLEVALTGMYQLTGFTAGAGLFRVGFARTYTANGTGGTAMTLTGDNNQVRTNMGASLLGDFRVATTAALGAGTKTYDTQDFGNYPKMILAAANTQVFEGVVLYKCETDDGEHPIVFAQNEGFGIRATVPATGTWVFGVRVKWAELAAY